jgi:hypothetical protein
MRKWIFMLSLLALSALAILPAAAQEDASVRIAHFSPDAPPVDIYVDGEVAVEGLQFTELTELIELPAGTYSIAVAPAGTSLEDAVIGPMEWAVEAGTYTTIAALGSLENGTLTVTVFPEDFGSTTDGQARITFLHTIEGESGLDLYGSGQQLVQNIRYPDAEAGRDGAFTREIPVGLYDFDATIAENRDAVVREVDDVQIQEGESYLIVALGPQSNEGTLLVLGRDGNSLEEEGTEGETPAEPEATEAPAEAETSEPVATDGTGMLRFANFIPDAPSIDIYSSGELILADLQFSEVTEFLPFDADSSTASFDIAPAGEGQDNFIGSFNLTIVPDTNITAAALGSAERGTVTATVFTEDYSNVPEGQARITLLHTIEGESGIDLYGSGILLMQNLRYPDAEAGRDGAFTVDVPAGRYNFDVTIAENANTVIREANGVEVAAGDTLLLVALGPQANEGTVLVVTPDGYELPEE